MRNPGHNAKCRKCGGTEKENPNECNTNVLFVGSLPLNATEDQVRGMLHAYGVHGVTLNGPNRGGKKSSARVEMVSIEAARAAWQDEDQHYIYDNQDSVYAAIRPYYAARK